HQVDHAVLYHHLGAAGIESLFRHQPGADLGGQPAVVAARQHPAVGANPELVVDLAGTAIGAGGVAGQLFQLFGGDFSSQQYDTVEGVDVDVGAFQIGMRLFDVHGDQRVHLHVIDGGADGWRG